MTAALSLAPEIGVRDACAAFDVPRATVYRRRQPPVIAAPRRSARALSDAERAELVRVLCSERFVDASPAEVQATLLDEGLYLASVSTLYRVLRALRSVRERRALIRHPSYARPELVATAPNQVWTWDITKIRGPDRRTWFHLYVILDLFSRYVVGWMFAATESASLAEHFIAQTVDHERVGRDTLTLHSDRGTSMRSKTVAEMLTDLGVTKSHSRPRTSNDNPFSESQFKTLKYSPFFPGSFASIDEGRTFFHLFFGWYNTEHHHSGIAMLTPATVHGRTVDAQLERRQTALQDAYAAHPERFVRGAPRAQRPAQAVWINRPPAQTLQPSGVAEPPPAASVRPSPAQRAHPKGEAKATERPEPPGATHSEASMARLARNATWPKTHPGVQSTRVGPTEATHQPAYPIDSQII